MKEDLEDQMIKAGLLSSTAELLTRVSLDDYMLSLDELRRLANALTGHTHKILAIGRA